MPTKDIRLYPTSSADRGAITVTSRLLSCIVTESLLRAVYLPLDSPNTAGLCIVLTSDTKDSEANPLDRLYRESSVFCAIPLHRSPILKRQAEGKLLAEIGLVDPMDMLPCVLESSMRLSEVVKNKKPWQAAVANMPAKPALLPPEIWFNIDPLHYWTKLANKIGTEPNLKVSIGNEIKSSQEWQEYVYENSPPYPTMASSSIEWEQSLIEGHPTHPMHRARHMVAPIPWLNPGDYDFYRPCIRLVAVPRSKSLLGGGDRFESLMQEFYAEASRNAGVPLPEMEDYLFVPVHELQIPNIYLYFKDALVLDPAFRVEAMAQASIRSVIVPDALPYHGLKLAVGMKISSALRTISHWTGDFGPRFTEQVVPKLSIDPKVLILEKEVASFVYDDPDPERQKHFTSIIREAYENTSELSGERVIICAALVERDPEGMPAIQAILNLNTPEKRLAYLDRYVRLILQGVLPPMLINGVAFEAHPQNMLARFDLETGELVGFVVRDLGGLRIHAPTLDASIGEHFEFLPDHCIPTKTVQDAYKKLYHTLFHNHLQRLIRVLDLHYDGSGWEIVRNHLEQMIPLDHPLRAAWLGPGSEFISGKCLLRMKLEGVYRDNVYYKMPNMIHYKGC